MLSMVMLSAIMPQVVIMSVTSLSVIKLNDILPSVVVILVSLYRVS
jgi:hypothetical protein